MALLLQLLTKLAVDRRVSECVAGLEENSAARRHDWSAASDAADTPGSGGRNADPIEPSENHNECSQTRCPSSWPRTACVSAGEKLSTKADVTTTNGAPPFRSRVRSSRLSSR